VVGVLVAAVTLTVAALALGPEAHHRPSPAIGTSQPKTVILDARTGKVVAVSADEPGR